MTSGTGRISNHHRQSTTQSEPQCGRQWPSTAGDIHEAGCGEFVLNWLHQTGDILFVLGYCVLAFVKLCFVAILRYELREMVQKIKILQNEMAQPFHEMTGILAMSSVSYSSPSAQQNRSPPAVVATRPESLSGSAHEHSPLQSPLQQQQPSSSQQQLHSNSKRALTVASSSTNGEVPFGGSEADAYCQFQVSSANSGRRSGGCEDQLEMRQQEPVSIYSKDYRRSSSVSRFHSSQPDLSSPPGTPLYLQRMTRLGGGGGGGGGAGTDSDSGSHCALLSDGQPQSAKDQVDRCELIHHWDHASTSDWHRSDRHSDGGGGANGWPGRTNGNNNEYHELREIKQTQI